MEYSTQNSKVKCKSLVATHELQCGFLGGPKNCSVTFAMECGTFEINVEQIGNRKIRVAADRYVDAKEMFTIHNSIEKFLMLLEGRFIPLKEYLLGDSDSVDESILNSESKERFSNRLALFKSADFCQHGFLKLVDFYTILTSETYDLWKQLLDEMDIAYQMFLYSISASFNVSDLRLAFLIELAEPFVEIIKARTHYFASLEPGGRGTTLKMCVDALLSKYGDDIFNNEFSMEYDNFLQGIVKCRNRIMHIKRNQTAGNFTGKENIRYVMKFSLLYRRILLELLGIDYNTYKCKLSEASSLIDN